jgi:hypothetical protein
MFCGRENTPLPIIEPITRAVSKPRRNGFAPTLAALSAGFAEADAGSESARFFMTDLAVFLVSGLGHFMAMGPLIWIIPPTTADRSGWENAKSDDLSRACLMQVS